MAVTYLESAYQTRVTPEALTDGSVVYVAVHPELRGCTAHGSTPEQALENLSDTFHSYAQHFAEHGLDMPEPSQGQVRQVVWRSIMIAPGAQTPSVYPQIGLPTGVGIHDPSREAANHIAARGSISVSR